MERWLERFAEAIFRRSADVNHDLKTPLNIAVLNLELLKMRLGKSGEGDKEKVREYASSIETELRRMARIFDVVLLESVPPESARAPTAVDLAPIVARRFPGAGGARGVVLAHEERAREIVDWIAEAAPKIFTGPPAVITEESSDGRVRVRLTGAAAIDASELGKLFKFYYSDTTGAPQIALAAARLLAECYGGALEARSAGDDIVLELALPSGEE
ncbi:MAG: histidine kinase dimerization/phospho-acceptor domain-containing protein [Thermoanaerobaculia bacterium]